MLYLVGVPIGNYGDMTFRAVETLKMVDVIAAEDTRKAKPLLQHFDIQGKDVLAHGAHNEHQSSQGLIKLMQEGKTIALITDSGMPTISDPGFYVAQEAMKAGIEVKVVPGVAAATTALAVSGVPADRFCFMGFLPRQTGERQRKLESLKAYPQTLIFYEAPHRVLAMLDDVRTVLGNRHMAMCRELTKTHEEILRGSVDDVILSLKNRDDILGEFTLIIHGDDGTSSQVDDAVIDEFIQQQLSANNSPKDVRDHVVNEFSLSKKEAYNRVLSVKNNT